MHFTRAITRTPGKDFAAGLTTVSRGIPDYALALSQHQSYCQTLQGLGLDVLVLPPAPDFPDAVFVEDTAIMIPGGAVITRPGATERRGEEASIAAALTALPPEAGIQTIQTIQTPGTLDGGDVMEVEGHYYIGLSKRTNEEGARQLGACIEAAGGGFTTVPVVEHLHLKTSVNYMGKNTLAVTPAFANLPELATFEKIILEPSLALASNSLVVNSTLIMPTGLPEARKKFAPLGWSIIEMDISEYQKMDGGLSCLSLRF